MPASLLDSLTGLITPNLASRAASMLGESDSSTHKAMTAALPVVLTGLASRASDATGNIVVNCRGKQKIVLQYNADLRAQRFQGELANIASIDQDATRMRIVKAQD